MRARDMPTFYPNKRSGGLGISVCPLVPTPMMNSPLCSGLPGNTAFPPLFRFLRPPTPRDFGKNPYPNSITVTKTTKSTYRNKRPSISDFRSAPSSEVCATAKQKSLSQKDLTPANRPPIFARRKGASALFARPTLAFSRERALQMQSVRSSPLGRTS